MSQVELTVCQPVDSGISVVSLGSFPLFFYFIYLWHKHLEWCLRRMRFLQKQVLQTTVISCLNCDPIFFNLTSLAINVITLASNDTERSLLHCYIVYLLRSWVIKFYLCSCALHLMYLQPQSPPPPPKHKHTHTKKTHKQTAKICKTSKAMLFSQ